MIDLMAQHIIPAALSLLPDKMDSKIARRHVLSICLQESALKHRRQIGGPAISFFQFEIGGVLGVMRHPATSGHLRAAVERLRYPLEPELLHEAMEHNDVLACVFARLNLWWLPGPLADDAEGAWVQYLEAWRPGKPHPKPWSANWAAAVAAT